MGRPNGSHVFTGLSPCWQNSKSFLHPVFICCTQTGFFYSIFGAEILLYSPSKKGLSPFTRVFHLLKHLFLFFPIKVHAFKEEFSPSMPILGANEVPKKTPLTFPLRGKNRLVGCTYYENNNYRGSSWLLRTGKSLALFSDLFYKILHVSQGLKVTKAWVPRQKVCIL